MIKTLPQISPMSVITRSFPGQFKIGVSGDEAISLKRLSMHFREIAASVKTVARILLNGLRNDESTYLKSMPSVQFI